jgi:hypothetical protein
VERPTLSSIEEVLQEEENRSYLSGGGLSSIKTGLANKFSCMYRLGLFIVGKRRESYGEKGLYTYKQQRGMGLI